MRPLLVSIALLLLALCRQSSAGPKISIQSIKKESSSSSVSILSSDSAKKQIEQNIENPPGTNANANAVGELMEKMGNFFIVITLQKEVKNLPKFLQDGLMHGMLCEADDSSLYSTIMSKVYPNNGYTTEQWNKEKTSLKDNKVFDCDNLSGAATADQTCFCTEKKPWLYCLVIFAKRMAAEDTPPVTKPAKCRQAALDALKQTGSNELGKLYDEDEVKDDSFEKLFSDEAAGIEAITKADAKMTKIFCDAVDQNVENAVIALYNADAVYWFAESAVYSLLFGEARRDLPTACKDSSFSGTKYGECVCKAMSGQGTGFSFCIYKVLAVYFKEIGFLTCEGEKKFEPTKKPSALPSILPKKAGGSSKASATTFSLLPPAAAAAALLLLRQ